MYKMPKSFDQPQWNVSTHHGGQQVPILFPATLEAIMQLFWCCSSNPENGLIVKKKDFEAVLENTVPKDVTVKMWSWLVQNATINDQQNGSKQLTLLDLIGSYFVGQGDENAKKQFSNFKTLAQQVFYRAKRRNFNQEILLISLSKVCAKKISQDQFEKACDKIELNLDAKNLQNINFVEFSVLAIFIANEKIDSQLILQSRKEQFIDKLFEIFKQIEVNCDNQISVDELHQDLEKCFGQSIPIEWAEKQIRYFDKTGKNSIDVYEFFEAVLSKSWKTQEKDIEKILQAKTKNNGKIAKHNSSRLNLFRSVSQKFFPFSKSNNTKKQTQQSGNEVRFRNIDTFQHLCNTEKTTFSEFAKELKQIAKNHGAVNHEFLFALENGNFSDMNSTLLQFALEYQKYSRNFRKYVKLILDKLSNDKHKSVLEENILEESGELHEEDYLVLQKSGIEREWVDKIPHSILFQNFIDALKKQVTNSNKFTKDKNQPGQQFADQMMNYYQTESVYECMGAISFGTEVIVEAIYRRIQNSIKKHTELSLKEYVFFPLHIDVDEGHAAAVISVISDMDSQKVRQKVIQGTLFVLDARVKLWDQLLQKLNQPQNSQIQNVSTLYDKQSSNWVRKKPNCLSDFTARPLVFETCEPVNGLKVLDVGCGEGFCARELRKRGASSILGIDISQEMINAAKQQELSLQQYPPINYIQGDPKNLRTTVRSFFLTHNINPQNLEQFNLVIAVFVFNYMPIKDMYQVGQDVFELLAPGGRFVFSVPHPSFKFWEKKENAPFYFEKGEGYFSGRDQVSNGIICTKDGHQLNVRNYHKTFEDYFKFLRDVGFEMTPIIQECRVTQEMVDADPKFFSPLIDVPLHVIFSAQKSKNLGNQDQVPKIIPNKEILWKPHQKSNVKKFEIVLDENVLKELISISQYCLSQNQTHENLKMDEILSKIPLTQKHGKTIRKKLLEINGLVIVKGLHPSQFERSQVQQQEIGLKIAYQILCNSIGEIDETRGKLFDVKNRNESVASDNVLFSASNEEATFHTDSSRIDYFPDIVGLLCIRPTSGHGGESKFTNVCNAYHALRTSLPSFLFSELVRPLPRDLIERGYKLHSNNEKLSFEQVFSSYWSGIGRSNEILKLRIFANSFPVFLIQDLNDVSGLNGITFRYMRNWIESGHSKSGVQMSPFLKFAMDELDKALEAEQVFDRQLQEGEIAFCNNHVVAHARTAFHDVPGKPSRLLVRAWIRA